MILVPLPFVVSILLLTLLIQTLRRDAEGFRTNPLFIALIAAYGVQSVLVGLRWGYDLREVLPVMSLLAMLIAPLAWLSFRSLTREEPMTIGSIWPHLLPAAAVAMLMMLWRDALSAVITSVFAAYGASLLWKARRGPDALVSARLDGVLRSHRAMQVTGIALLLSAATDLVIDMDLALGSGAYSAALISAANVAALLVLGAAASIAGSGTVGVAAGDPPVAAAHIAATQEDRTTAGRIERLMQDHEIYLDPDLNLERIARKLHLPARAVSSAINRAHAMSVSHYVNTYRVKRACRLLRGTGNPVTTIMFEAGFATKSNFNREFQRVTGMTPSAYRRAEHLPDADPALREAVPKS